MKARVKGTNWYLNVISVSEAERGDTIGLYCTYLNGPYAGQSMVIPGDCIVEDN